MQEQRKRVRSTNPAERLAAALLIPAELSRRLRLLSDSQMGRLLDDEICANMSILAPEATVCSQAREVRAVCRCGVEQVVLSSELYSGMSFGCSNCDKRAMKEREAERDRRAALRKY